VFNVEEMEYNGMWPQDPADSPKEKGPKEAIPLNSSHRRARYPLEVVCNAAPACPECENVILNAAVRCHRRGDVEAAHFRAAPI
jgi:hypothetical protein